MKARKRLPVWVLPMVLLACLPVGPPTGGPPPPRGGFYGAASAAGLDSLPQLDRRIAELRASGQDEIDYTLALRRYLQLRAWPHDELDHAALLRTMQDERLRVPPAAVRHRMSARPIDPSLFGPSLWSVEPVWRFTGPHDLRFGDTNVSARVNATLYDPVASDTYYVGVAGGGVWKTTDAGQQWLPLSDTWPCQSVSSLAADAARPGTIYAGTGDFAGGVGTGCGLMKSTDGGATWKAFGVNELGAAAIARVLVDPDDGNIVTVAAGNGLWCSTDAGATFARCVDDYLRPLPEQPFFDVQVGMNGPGAPSGGHWYWAIAGGGEARLYRSGGRGRRWTSLPIYLGSKNEWGLALAPSKIAASYVYLLSAADMKVYASFDAGKAWTSVTGDLTQNGWDWNQGWYDWTLACAREGAGANAVDVLYVGLKHIFVSTARDEWRQIARAHDDQHAMTVNPRDPRQLLVGSDGGVHRYAWANDPTVGDWAFVGLNATIGTLLFYKTATSSTDMATVIGGTQDNGTVGAQGDLGAWRYLASGDGGSVAINQTDDAIQYAIEAIGAYGLYHTFDRWQTSQRIEPEARGAPMAPVVIDALAPRAVYWATDYLYQRDEQAGKWLSRVGGQQLATCQDCYVTDLAVAPTSSFRLYAGTNSGQLWTSAFAGNTWTAIEGGSPALPGRAIQAIDVDPTEPTRVLVGLSGTEAGHVWRCDNVDAQARTWIDVSGTGPNRLPDVSVNALARDFRDPTRVFYAGTDLGVYATTDGGATWFDGGLPFGLPRSAVTDLQVLPSGELQAATFGRGLWRARITQLVDGYPELTIVAHLQDLGDRNAGQYAWAGTKGQSRRLEGFSIDLSAPAGLGVEYLAHVQDLGDTAWTPGGQFVGTRGLSRRVEGFAVRLTGPLAADYHVLYQAHLQDVGDTPVCADGAYCGTRGESRRLEAMRVWIARR